MSPKNRVQIVNNKMRHLFKITEFLTFHAEMKVATFLVSGSQPSSPAGFLTVIIFVRQRRGYMHECAATMLDDERDLGDCEGGF